MPRLSSRHRGGWVAETFSSSLLPGEEGLILLVTSGRHLLLNREFGGQTICLDWNTVRQFANRASEQLRLFTTHNIATQGCPITHRAERDGQFIHAVHGDRLTDAG